MFISAAYGKKLWTNHERKAAQARAFGEAREYILPVRFDDTEIPGVLPTIGYLSLKNRSSDKLVSAIVNKLSTTNQPNADSLLAVRPIVQPDVGLGALQLEVGESGRFFETGSANSLYTHTRTLKLRVSNNDTHVSLTECKVHVINIEPREYEGPWLLREGFSLAAGDHVFVPLASYLEPNDIMKSPYGASFMEILADKNRPMPPTSQRHVLTIRATALGSPFCEIKCALWVDDSGRLRIERNGTSSEALDISARATERDSPRIILNEGADDSAGALRKYINDGKINVTMTVDENKITLYGISSGHTLEIVHIDQEYYHLREDLGNHPTGFQTRMTAQIPRWSAHGSPMTQSQMLTMAKRWLHEQAGI